MKKKLTIQISILAVLFLALGMEAWAGCGCRQRCNHNQNTYNRYRGLENHPQFSVSARSPANNNGFRNGVQNRYVEPIIVNPGYGYGYGNGYNGYGYNGYNGYSGYGYRGNYYNQGNCRQPELYRR
jgi:hypothetical protein